MQLETYCLSYLFSNLFNQLIRHYMEAHCDRRHGESNKEKVSFPMLWRKDMYIIICTMKEHTFIKMRGNMDRANFEAKGNIVHICEWR